MAAGLALFFLIAPREVLAITDVDRALHSTESQMKDFRPLSLGVMRLEKGRGLLTLRPLKMPGRSVMDVRQVNLTLRP